MGSSSVILIRKNSVCRQGSSCSQDNWIVASDTISSVRFATCGTSEVCAEMTLYRLV